MNKRTKTLQNSHLKFGKDTNENGMHTGLTSLIAPVYNFIDLPQRGCITWSHVNILYAGMRNSTKVWYLTLP